MNMPLPPGRLGAQATAGRGAGLSLHAYLTRLIWLCVTPLLLLGAYLAFDSVRSVKAEHDREAANLASNFAKAIDHHLMARISALNMLAVSPLADDPARWQDLYQQAQGFQQSFGSHVIFADAAMRMLFNTRSPFGAALPALPRPTGQAAAPTALATGKPAVGDILFGPVAKKPLVAIAVPVLRRERAAFLILSTFETEQFQERIQQVALPAAWSLSLLDSTGAAIARRGPPGMETASDADAIERFVVKSEVAPWSVVLEIPRAAYRAPLVWAALAMAAAILGAVLVSVLGGRLAGRRLGRSVASLAEAPAPGAPPPAIVEIARVRQVLDEAARQREAAEAALRRSESRLQTLIDYAPADLAMFDKEMRYLAVSRRWCEDYRLGEVELIGRSHYEIFPEIPEAWRAAHRRGLAGEVLSAEADRFERADGSVQWLHWEIRPWYEEGGQVGGIVIFAEDISERMQMLQALQHSRELLRLITDAAPALISYVDADCRYRLVNRGYQRWFGLPPQEIVGQPVEAVLGGQVWEKVRPWMLRALAGEAVSYEQEVPHRDGGMRWVSVSYTPDRDGEGRVHGFVVLVQDISARVAAEAEIRRFNAELEQRVEAATAELKAANAELESYAYAIAHDLRAPLRAMSGFGQILAGRYGERLDADGRQFLDHIVAGAGRMGELIEGLLQLARTSRAELSWRTVDLSEMARGICAELAAGEPERAVRCEVEDGLVAEGDPRLLAALLRNLLGNAWKYSARAAEASIRFFAAGGQPACFCVADNGAGFDMAHAGQLFQPFRRLHSQGEFPGIGIGLATVHRIVQRHGGDIRAEAAPGEGARFYFTLAGNAGSTVPEHSPKPMRRAAAASQ